MHMSQPPKIIDNPACQAPKPPKITLQTPPSPETRINTDFSPDSAPTRTCKTPPCTSKTPPLNQ